MTTPSAGVPDPYDVPLLIILSHALSDPTAPGRSALDSASSPTHRAYLGLLEAWRTALPETPLRDEAAALLEALEQALHHGRRIHDHLAADRPELAGDFAEVLAELEGMRETTSHTVSSLAPYVSPVGVLSKALERLSDSPPPFDLSLLEGAITQSLRFLADWREALLGARATEVRRDNLTPFSGALAHSSDLPDRIDVRAPKVAADLDTLRRSISFLSHEFDRLTSVISGAAMSAERSVQTGIREAFDLVSPSEREHLLEALLRDAGLFEEYLRALPSPRERSDLLRERMERGGMAHHLFRHSLSDPPPSVALAPGLLSSVPQDTSFGYSDREFLATLFRMAKEEPGLIPDLMAEGSVWASLDGWLEALEHAWRDRERDDPVLREARSVLSTLPRRLAASRPAKLGTYALLVHDRLVDAEMSQAHLDGLTRELAASLGPEHGEAVFDFERLRTDPRALPRDWKHSIQLAFTCLSSPDNPRGLASWVHSSPRVLANLSRLLPLAFRDAVVDADSPWADVPAEAFARSIRVAFTLDPEATVEPDVARALLSHIDFPNEDTEVRDTIYQALLPRVRTEPNARLSGRRPG